MFYVFTFVILPALVVAAATMASRANTRAVASVKAEIATKKAERALADMAALSESPQLPSDEALDEAPLAGNLAEEMERFIALNLPSKLFGGELHPGPFKKHFYGAIDPADLARYSGFLKDFQVPKQMYALKVLDDRLIQKITRDSVAEITDLHVSAGHWRKMLKSIAAEDPEGQKAARVLERFLVSAGQLPEAEGDAPPAAAKGQAG